MGGWLETDNRAISVQLNLTGTATGTELGNILNEVIYLTKFLVKSLEGAENTKNVGGSGENLPK